MPEPYMSEIRVFAFPYVPNGWAACDGQLLAINQYQALYSLLGNTYGGQSPSTFALPNLNGRVPVGTGGATGTIVGNQGALGGEASHALQASELPAHTHVLHASALDANQGAPAGHVLAKPAAPIYAADDPAQNTTLDASSMANTGAGLGHENRQPSLGLIYCIALNGIYPTRP